MEKNRSSKIIAVLALVVGVAGLSLGFAAFSNTLTIQSSAEVKPDDSKFNVDFSTSTTAVETDPVVATLNKTAEGFTATNGTIDNSTDPVISNLKATFTEPGQTATYSFYAYNAGEYDAFLKSITFENVAGESAAKVCTPATGTTAALVASACEGISVSVKVGTESVTTGSIASITNHSLLKAAAEPVVVTISYDSDAAIADGDFSVAFGDIKLSYASVD